MQGTSCSSAQVPGACTVPRSSRFLENNETFRSYATLSGNDSTGNYEDSVVRGAVGIVTGARGEGHESLISRASLPGSASPEEFPLSSPPRTSRSVDDVTT